MNRRNMMKGMSALMVMTSFAMIASVVAAQEGDTATAAAHWDAQKLGAGLALALTPPCKHARRPGAHTAAHRHGGGCACPPRRRR